MTSHANMEISRGKPLILQLAVVVVAAVEVVFDGVVDGAAGVVEIFTETGFEAIQEDFGVLHDVVQCHINEVIGPL